MQGKHVNHTKSADHVKWSEEKMIASTGYTKVRVGKTHPLADPNGYAYEHLVIWCAAGLARPTSGQLIHHKNENKTDNRIENLELKRRPEHSAGHQPGALPDHEIFSLREDCAAGDHTGILAKRYGISIQAAWKIVTGRTRLNADGPIQGKYLRKSRAGRMLDGREHNDMPQVRS